MRQSPTRKPAFTLVELMVSIAILAIILTTLATVLQQASNSWRQARAQLEQFREAELALSTLSRRISDAVLNTYHDYEFPNNDPRRTPTRYIRQSELHFVAGQARDGTAQAPALLGPSAAHGHAIFFQAPFGEHQDPAWDGLNTLLNAWGYFVEFADDLADRPPGLVDAPYPIAPRYRFRLRELRQPAERFQVYADDLPRLPTNSPRLYDWFRQPVAASDGLTTLAENVLALIIRPLAPQGELADPTLLAPAYHYDSRAFQQNVGAAFPRERSRHQLPPLLEITLVVIDEASALRLQEINGTSQPDLGLGGLFTDPKQHADDLAALQGTLSELGLDHRTLSQTIRLRNSRWSIQD